MFGVFFFGRILTVGWVCLVDPGLETVASSCVSVDGIGLFHPGYQVCGHRVLRGIH